VHTRGERCVDFMLADIFGASLAGEESGAALYLLPRTEDVAAMVAPQRYVSAMPPMEGMTLSGRGVQAPSLRLTSGELLATLSVPFGHPNPGTVLDRNWSSIHSWPPHTDTDAPVIVGNAGCVYSSVVLEETNAAANERLFVGLVRRLLDGRERWSADAHPAVWVSAFEQPSRVTMTFVNYSSDLPVLPVEGVRLLLRPPDGKRFVDVVLAPDGERVPFEIAGDGTLTAELARLEEFAMVIASY
jgi:hypothetical protein